MAIDFLIFAVLLLSFIINFLALAAFWVTPGLRTTANRFTINLLIINLVGCLILAPTLFLSGGIVGDGDSESGTNDSSLTTGSSQSGLSFLTTNTNDDSIEFYSKAGNHQMTIRHNGKLVEQEGIILRRNVSHDGENGPRTIETIYKCNTTYCRELTIDENSETLVITEIEEEGKIQLPIGMQQEETDEVKRLALPLLTMRSWAIDMAAALGAMGVLLVVGDTWCAVTDPLRYHSRISGVKSWVLIAITWAMGILFGALSAFREIDFESETIISKQKRFADSSTTFFTLNSVNNIFSMVFSCLYFLLIILLPFGFVCGMYWRIFSEARENGLRMRQNGSSPLLQSALNLTHGPPVANQQYSNSLCVHRNSISSTSSQCGGLQMQIDNNQKRGSPACLRRDSAAKVLLPPISDDGMSDEADNCSTNDQLIVIPVTETANTQQQQQQNIILTLQTASGEIKRNYSTRQLELLATSSQDLCDNTRLQGIRQVHSSPNLQRSVTLPQPLNENTCSPHLLGGHLPQNLPSIHLNRHSFQQNPNNTRTTHQNHQHLHHHQSLQIPTIQASPKALSYMSSLRHRLSNASSLFKYRDESRAARISILVVIMFLVSYLPFGFLVLLQSRVPAANFEESSQLAIFMILLANLSSPFIFAYRNKRVRRGVKRLVGLDAICRDSQLQRQNSSSCRMSGSKYGNSNLKRNSSRVSTYSTTSAKYLTPQSSVVSNGTNSVPACFMNNNNNTCPQVPLRPNSSCSTIINFSLNKQPQTLVETDELKSNQPTNKKPRPVLQRGITIIEQVPLNGNDGGICSGGNSIGCHNSSNNNNTPKLPVKHKLYKLLFKSSKNLSCAAAQSCAQGTLDAEPTEV
ncbi:hypothetical protein FF38_00347 [Lucilia cuprina]|uniref:G-protein coupled receptors family 1 profile domain-containing protein n=1 Tax=Lucilia cuprina TaxID=7375 RepID=A0A0L0CB37_LUCCU|nr:hypothetical protein CVS40_7205 [Lucilia cuprina]KNC29435.1 hypothetical protein FF38_00347 [Lucilia cuprina]